VKLALVQLQVLGDWKWYRQIFLDLIVIAMIVSAVNLAVKRSIAAGVQGLLLLLSFHVELDRLTLLVPDLLLFLFVVVSEAWIWLYRLRGYWSVRAISELETKYVIEPKAAAATE
jgi:hypothetical protein